MSIKKPFHLKRKITIPFTIQNFAGRLADGTRYMLKTNHEISDYTSPYVIEFKMLIFIDNQWRYHHHTIGTSKRGSWKEAFFIGLVEMEQCFDIDFIKLKTKDQ